MRLLACTCSFAAAIAAVATVSALGCGAAGANAFAGGTGGSVSGGGGATTSGTTSSGVALTGSGGAPGTGGSLPDAGGSMSGTTGSTASSSSSSSSGADAGTSASGDCHKGADCPSGQCVAVTPGGFQVCLVPPVPATSCTGGTLDLCCPSTNVCAGQAACDVGPLVPVCGGAQMVPHNQCAVAQCTKDVDCAPGQICAPAGTLGLGVAACIDAHCKVDADCTAHPGGVCAPAQNPCCAATSGLYCDYPANGGCRTSADCPGTGTQPTRYCDPDPISGAAACQAGAPICPG